MKRRQAGVVRREGIGSDAAADHQARAQYFHQDQKQQCPGDQGGQD